MLDQPLHLTNQALFSLLGGVVSILGAAVVALTVYSFRQSIGGLTKSLDDTCRKISALFDAHDRQSRQIAALDRDLASLRAEHAIMLRSGRCMRETRKRQTEEDDDDEHDA